MSKGDPASKSCQSCDSQNCKWYDDSGAMYICLDCGKLSNIYYRTVKFSDIGKLFKEKKDDDLFTWEDYEKE